MNKLALQKKELKQQLASDEYRTLLDVLLDPIRRVIQRFLRNSNPPPYWVSALLIGAAVPLARMLLSALLDAGPILFHFQVMLQFELPVVAVAVVSLIALRAYDTFILQTLEQHVVGRLEREDDLDNLRDWLIDVYANKGKCLLFAFATSTGVMYYVIYFWLDVMRIPVLSYGACALFYIVLFQAGIYVYYVIMLADLSLRIRKYHFQLHAVAPDQSEIIYRLASIQSPLVYLTVGFATVSTAYFAIGNIMIWSNLLLVLLGGWFPLSILFVSNQIGLGGLIRRAKQRTLYELQAEIDRLHRKEMPPSKETLEHVRALVNYYEMIRSKPNSALNFRAVSGYIYNLLLPLFGILLANLDKLIALIR